jgi:phosphate transport system substrate-binding protein
VSIKRQGKLAGAGLTALLALAGCGSDNTTDVASDASSGSAIDCATGSLTAQGATSQVNAMDEWIKAYQKACSDATINYQGTGSGAGIQAFIGGTADFAGSDSALKSGDEQTKADGRCKDGAAVNLPLVTGPIALAYNLGDLKDLQLKPATIAKIFSGAVKTWDDPIIKADNPGVTLPATQILAIHRADSSGTTDNFTKYLATTGGSDWSFGNDKVWKAPGGSAEKGSDGVASAISRNAGAIGYIEWSFAQTSKLNMAKVFNGAGEFVALTAEAAGKAVAGATAAGSGNDHKLTIDYKTTSQGAYPLVLVTYEIVCEKGNGSGKLPLLKSFLTYTSGAEGQSLLTSLGYAPLPDEVRAKVAATVATLS